MRVDTGALKRPKQPSFMWADCRCPQCHVVHRDVVPRSEYREGTQRDGIRCGVHCDACYRKRSGARAADMYVALREAIIHQHKLGSGGGG